jgi:hypothetical protein
MLDTGCLMVDDYPNIQNLEVCIKFTNKIPNFQTIKNSIKCLRSHQQKEKVG